jgi:localization factor PodJL
MKFGVPWSVKGIRPEARESAREAARRSGMSLGEWLNNVILEQEEGRAPGHEDDDDGDYADELAGVHDRLDELTRKISHFSRGAAKAAPRSRGRSRDVRHEEPDRLAELIGRLDHRIEQLVHVSARAQMPPPMPAMPQHIPQHIAPPVAPYAQHPHPAVAAYAPPMHRPQAYSPQQHAPAPQRPAELDRALAEIAARQRMLNGQPPLPAAAPAQAPQPAPVLAQVPAQDLSGLEDQLRRITDQIETLRKPGVEEAINALRDELGDIGRALNEAMPRRAIDTIEKQIQGLTQRIAEGRQAGADQHAVAGLEHGLAEVRDALRGLTPAESLVGFNDAVSGLAHKIDLIVAQKDPATLQQLEHAITTLRDMAGHVASNDAVSELAAQVHALSQKVEYLGAGGGGDALNHLEQRIDALSQALAERAQNGGAVPPRLESLVQSLSDKIELIQESRADNPVAGHLEDRIVHLVQRLDASDSRLGHLEAIERGLGDLLVQIDEMRASKSTDALRAEAESAVGVDSLKVDLARTQNALENVNGTLSAVVDRLARIESDIRDEGRRRASETEPLELTQPMGRVTARAVPEMAPPPVPQQHYQEPPQHLPPAPPLELTQPAPAPVFQAPQPAPQPQPPQEAQRRMPQARVQPIDPDLPPDQPLEPGSGPPRQRVGARIAVGEARAAAATPAPASNFIAAARRAAQSAVKAAPRPPRADATDEPVMADEAPRGLMKRMKSLFVAASIVAIAIGTVQVGGKYLLGDSPPAPVKTAERAPVQPPPLAAEEDDDEPSIASAAPASPLAPALSTPSSIITNPTPMIPMPAMPSPLAAPALSTTPAPAARTDVTGSIPPSAMRTPAVERLPTEIGGPNLRSAALGGNAAAAYEIAVRYAEGRGVPANAEEAARWYERAAGKGVALAQFRYAAMLEKGHGVRKDLAQARRLYLAAASKGNAKAMHNLAVLYAEGIEGKPDYATAAQWFRKAAEHGVADSQYNLGVLAARGLGTPKSMTDAYKWFALAGAQGDKEAARKRDDVASQMDAATLGQAQAAVKSFAPIPQPQEAVAVTTPPGGWDEASPAHPAPLSKHRSGTYKVGNR